MDWRSHAVIGLILGFVASLLLGSDVVAILMITAFSGLSALVPDLDHDASKGRQWLDLAFVAFAGMTVYGSGCGTEICIPGVGALGEMLVTFLAMAGVYFLFFRFLKPRHRGITHTLLACFAFGVLVYFMAGKALAIAGIVGYFSHLAADQHVKLI